MRKFSKTYLLPLVILLAICASVFAFRPQKVSVEKAKQAQDRVISVTQNRLNDVVIRFEHLEGVFYIRDGIKKGLNVDELNTDLRGKIITINYVPGVFNATGWGANTYDIVQAKEDNQVVFSRFE
ncbi:hypothetical protein GS399_19045 [Pedobacter sp. HMF7647]|uniref:Uncharacterized protein n=1 Tax=Hufsiella arboris TaxID=2695275 RepID=A0A7K1YEQ5_9SPHI|nr:hypothetical protein [Hufsiella arboris]MXV53072.1 hypothetical protein [Hufsiella arboris]